MMRQIILPIFCLVFFCHEFHGQIVISEACSSNNLYEDEWGDKDDWIELFNAGTETVDLNGYYISDDAAEPDKHQLTEINAGDFIMEPGQYLVLWADNETDEGHQHLSFALSMQGDYLNLSDNELNLLDAVSLPFMYNDISFGVVEGEWVFFLESTPGEDNSAEHFAGILSKPQYENEVFFIAGTEDVVFTHEMPEAEIRYTTDGTVPTIESDLFTTAISINESETFLARAFLDGYIPSLAAAKTYIAEEAPEDLDVAFIVAADDELWDGSYGIYDNPYNNIEITVGFTYVKTTGEILFNHNLGMKIHAPDGIDQKGLRFYARSEYGASSIGVPLFEQREYTDTKRFILRNGGNDALNLNRTLQRDILATESWSEVNNEYGWAAFQPVHVYLNKEYWGIYNLRERQDMHWLTQQYGYEEDEVNYLERTAGESDTRNEFAGDWVDYDLMEQTAIDLDLSIDDNYAVIEDWISIDNFIDYEFTEIFFGNKDWLSNNIKLWRPIDNSRKWEWILWDLDYGLGCYYPIYDHGFPDWNTLSFALSNWGGWTSQVETELLQNLVENASFVHAFSSRGADLMNSTYRIDHLLNRLDENAAAIESELPLHYDRWGGSMTTWYAKVDALEDYLTERHDYVRGHYSEQFDLGEIFPITLSVEPEGAGYIEVNTIETDEDPWEGLYYENVPVRIKAIANPGYTFDHWNEEELQDVELFVDMIGAQFYTAYFEEDETEVQNMVINEIHYEDSPEYMAGDWIELYNPNSFQVNLNQWVISDENNSYTFEGETIEANALIILSTDPEAFSIEHPEITNVVGPIGFGLDNGGEMIQLTNPEGVLVDEVEYGISSPWPIANAGASIQLVSPILNNAYGGNWFTNEVFGGTPNAFNQVIVHVDENENNSGLLCYPNPFSESLNILTSTEHGELKYIDIYDSFGRHVETINGFYMTGGGHYYYEWQPGAQVSTGVYLVRATYSNEIVSQQVQFQGLSK